MGTQWATTLITPPTAEPVSVSEARDHLRIDTTNEDALIARRIKSARRGVEVFTRRQLITATWELHLDAFPRGGKAIRVPYPPLQSVTSITYVDGDGVEQTWASAEYRVDTDSEPGRITEAHGESYPSTHYVTGAVTVTYVAGYGDAGSDVEEELREAIEVLVAGKYEFREPAIVGTIVTKIPMPMSAESYMLHHRVLRFDGPIEE